MDRINECASWKLAYQSCTYFSTVTHPSNALVVNSVWSQGLAVCASPSVTDVSLTITVFYRSLLSLSACKICIDSSMEKLYTNYRFLRTGIVLLTTVQ